MEGAPLINVHKWPDSIGTLSCCGWEKRNGWHRQANGSGRTLGTRPGGRGAARSAWGVSSPGCSLLSAYSMFLGGS